MLHQILTIARYTLLEALRMRLAWVVVLVLLAAFGGSFFVKQIAITDSARIQVTFLAATLRPASVFLLSLSIISAMTREFNDKGLALLLSQDLPRTGYVLGKLAGYCAAALLLTLAVSFLLAIFVPVGELWVWTVSLLCELWIIAAFSMFCAITFNQTMPAATFVLAFYLLARSIATIQLIGHAGLTEAASPAQHAMSGVIDAIALVLPRFDSFTQTTWLVNHGGGWQALAPVSLQTLIYLVLLAAGAMFDLYRKDI